MKRYSLILMILCGVWFMSCEKDKNGPKVETSVTLMDGSVVIKTNPKVAITKKGEWLESNWSDESFSPTSKISAKAAVEYDENSDLRAEHYRFKLVAEVETIVVSGVTVQATHVKLTDDGYAFVSFNEQYDGHRGGVIVFKYKVIDGPLETATVEVEAVQMMEMPNAEISAVDYINGKLFMTGASIDQNFGYDKTKDFNPAFFMVAELDANKKFKEEDVFARQLTSFQGTSLRATSNRIYVTTGDGTGEGAGGLYVFNNAADYPEVAFIEADHARSVDVDATNIYLMQAEPARVTKYGLDGSVVNSDFYITTDHAMQEQAKSEILAWDKFVFVAQNESGLSMLAKSNGAVVDDITLAEWKDQNWWDKERHVINSVCMNDGNKKNIYNKEVQTNLLFTANGEKGIYWYEILKDKDGKDVIVPAIQNSALAKPDISANFIASKGNVVFVANGLGGLKVLYIGATKDPDWDCTYATSAYTYLRTQGSGDTKVGDIFFQAEGENLCVYIYGCKNGVQLKDIGCLLATNWDEIVASGVVDDKNSTSWEDWKISPSGMKDFNKQYRTTISGKDGYPAVKFTFPKKYIDELAEHEKLICVIYGSDGWGFGEPTSPSGGTGGGQVNNSMYFFLGDIDYCEPIKH